MKIRLARFDAPQLLLRLLRLLLGLQHAKGARLPEELRDALAELVDAHGARAVRVEGPEEALQLALRSRVYVDGIRVSYAIALCSLYHYNIYIFNILYILYATYIKVYSLYINMYFHYMHIYIYSLYIFPHISVRLCVPLMHTLTSAPTSTGYRTRSPWHRWVALL